MLSCYPDWQGDSVFDELLHELRTDCSTLQRQMQGRSLPPRWLEVPYSARDIRGGGMMCTVLADSWNRLGRGLRLLAVKGSRSKKVVQSLVVEVAAGLGLGFDRQANLLLKRFPEYSSEESLETALKKAAQLVVKKDDLQCALVSLDGLNKAYERYLPDGTNWIEWVFCGFPRATMRRE